ncbi:MAG: tetratricopeptide repeat protein [Bacteroidetes bacterium]|nr:tetratricopeptide repeat protein [Bacteroidota bacterium]
MFKKRSVYFLLFFLWLSVSFAGNKEKIEKLIQKIAQDKEDTIKVLDLIDLSTYYYYSDLGKAVKAGQEALDISNKLNYNRGAIRALNSLADNYWYRSNYDKAFNYYYKAYRISDSIHDKGSVAEALYNLGWISCIQQKHYKDDIYLYKSLKIATEIKDTNRLSALYNAFASYYSNKFMDLLQRKNFDSSLIYFKKGIDLCKKTRSYRGLSVFYANFGDLFYAAEDFQSAEFYYLNSYDLSVGKSDSSTTVSLKFKIARCRTQFGDVKKQLPDIEFARDFFERHESNEYEMEILSFMPELYYKLGRYKEGYDSYKIFVTKQEEAEAAALATSISNLENNYSLEKAEANVTQLKKDNEITELKNKKKNYFIFGLIAIALVVLIITFLLFRQNKLKQLTNTQLQEQNNIIKEKKEEIEHSIQYAKGIQLAILPEIRDLNDRFKESFVIYKPKDVVSGDFYWFAKVEDDFYCVAADCTGHGVPGALMSIIGTDKINQAIFEKKLTSPGEILSFLNVQIKNVLKQHSDASIQKDGMDIAILKFNANNTEVEYSAANRPLFLIRNKEIIEYKATKTAIAGFTPNEQVFENHTISVNKNDTLYIFTDGYADQFGGPMGGKKMMTRKLKEMMIEISNLPATEQQKTLENTFRDWKSTFEQTDDVLVIGITI